MTMTREEIIDRDMNIYILCEDIINDFPPKYWSTEEDGTVLKMQVVSKFSTEYDDILNDVKDAEHKYSSVFGQSNSVWFITRVENKFTYARFILTAKHLEQYDGIKVVQKRMFKLAHITEMYQTFKYRSGRGILGYNYNLNLMKFGQGSAGFYSYIPYMPPDFSVIAVQILIAESDSHCDVIYSNNNADFYIEYIINYKS